MAGDAARRDAGDFVYDYQAPKGSDDKSLVAYIPAHWDYAVVKYAKNYTAYSDYLNDNVLSVGIPVGKRALSNGISNVRFYSVLEPWPCCWSAPGSWPPRHSSGRGAVGPSF